MPAMLPSAKPSTYDGGTRGVPESCIGHVAGVTDLGAVEVARSTIGSRPCRLGTRLLSRDVL